MAEWKVRAGAGLLLVGVCSAFLVWSFPAAYSSRSLVVLGLAAVLLETLSPKILRWGYQSCAVGAYAAMSVAGEVGPGPAQLVMLNSLVIRGLLRGRSHSQGWLWDFLLDALPLSLFLSSLKLFHGSETGWLVGVALLVALCYYSPMIVPETVPGTVRQSKKSLLPVIAGMALLGLYWPRELSHVIPGVLLYGSLVYGAWESARTRAVSREELAQTHLGLVRDFQEGLYEEIERKSELARHQARNRKLLEAIQKNFIHAGSYRQGLSALLKLVDGLFKPRSTVIFLYLNGQLRPYLFRSPDGKALEAAELTGLSEPMVEACWRENRSMSRRRRIWPEKLLPEERSVAVTPIPGYGVLYLGRPKQLFDGQVVETLSLVGRQASYLMQSLTEKLTQKQQIDFVSDEKRRLSLWLDRLDQLLLVSRRLSECSSPAELYAVLEERLSSLIPHHYFAAVGDGENPIRFSEEASWRLSAVASLVSRVAAEGKGHLLNSFPREDLVPIEGATSALLVPMNRLKTALMLVDCQSSNKYNQEHLDLLRMLGQLAESALLRMRLQEEYLSASKAAAIGQMAAGLSHELNTPLGVIQLEIGMADTLLDSSPTRARQHLQRAEQALDTSQRILAALLYYTTSYAVTRELIDLKQTIQRTLSEPAFESVRFESQGADFRLQAYSLDLDQLLKQLLYNALEATEAVESPEIKVRLSEQRGWLQVEVFDNGKGVPNDIRERVFEPFFTTKPVGRGLGLGLAVAAQIAVLHDGNLVLESTSPQGSCFLLKLPRESGGD
ncbi:MAG: HAMP domain-containing histidine kinase [Candidatus Eremiobacteraeota bacterium]|nr:HAMP domain-containing histidine kinase [Candidatus Eremiobacteraeota bacterium]